MLHVTMLNQDHFTVSDFYDNRSVNWFTSKWKAKVDPRKDEMK